jgi:autotransporter-associated beta strand protein
LLSLVAAQMVSAQTYTVSSTADSGAGSLRDAISQANAFNGAATINFSITASTVNLSSMLPILTNPNGITINGNGNTINGGSTSNTTGDRVFFIGVPSNTPAAGGGFMPSTAATNWNINNLTIQNGNGRGGNGAAGGAGLGGGVFVNAGNLSLSNVQFNNNRAIGGNGGSLLNLIAGGGMGGNGNDGGGGFGIGANGGVGNANGAPGKFMGGASAANGTVGTGGVHGGGGGGAGVFSGSGGSGGVGAIGENAGFGGGGSGDGIGGFGGGGGNTGDGGFGGGSGFSRPPGFGGGAGTSSGSGNGGGGLGAGGAIFVRQGATLSITDGGISGGTVAGGTGFQSGQAIGSGIFLAGSVNYNVTSGTVILSDGLGGGFNSQITGGFTKTGAGTLVLAGNNTFSGGTTIAGPSGSTLRLGNNVSLGQSTNSLTINTGNILDLSGSSTSIGTLTGTGTITNTSVVTLSDISVGNGNGSSTFSGVIQNGTQAVSLTKTGTGTLTLSGTNAYTGGTNLNGGILSVSSNANLGHTSSVLFFNGGTLQTTSTFATSRGTAIEGSVGVIDVTAGNTLTHTGQISGPGALTKSGAGILVLGFNNIYTGTTTVADGTLQVGNGASTGSLGAGQATINAGATLRYFRNDQHSLTTSLAGNGTLNFIGTGNGSQSSYILTGINNSSFAGALQVGSTVGNGARVVINNQNQLGTSSATINNGSQIFMQGTFSNNFTIQGNGWQEGAGSLGALRMDDGSTITGSVTLAGNSRIGTSTSAAISGVISGGFGVEKNLLGTLTLSGTNTYTGSTTVNAGTLLINGNQTAANGSYTVNNGATLGGSGTIGGSVTVNSGGILSPGNSPGILTVNNVVALQNGAQFLVEMQGTTAGSGYDQLQISSLTASFSLNGSVNLVGDRLGSFAAPFLSSYVILRNTNNVLGTGTFAGLADGSFFDLDGQVFQIRYNVPNTYNVDPQLGITWAGDNGFGNYGGGDNGGNIVIAAVPEPSTWVLMLGSLGICGYAAYRRKLRQAASEGSDLFIDRV